MSGGAPTIKSVNLQPRFEVMTSRAVSIAVRNCTRGGSGGKG